MKVIKRSGIEVDFNREKLCKSIERANAEAAKTTGRDLISDDEISTIATRLYERCRKRAYSTTTEELQDMIEIELMKVGAYEVAKQFIKYRFEKEIKEREATPVEIVLYTQKGCSKCDILKKEMKKKNIDFDEVSDIEEMIAMGLSRTPVLKVGESLMEYDSAIKWIFAQ